MKNWIMLGLIGLIFFVHTQPGYGSIDPSSSVKVIPDEAIRLRILAHSNSEEDQTLKRAVRDRVNQEITTWVEHLTSIEHARNLIESRIDEINGIVGDVLDKYGSQYDYDVKYGQVSFPAKMYGNVLYPPGEYEAILITIGAGKGDNWWCVLFPPLCFLDFSNGTTVSPDESEKSDEKQPETGENNEKVEVKFLVIEWFHQLWSWLASLFS
ncbi:stage II sporulation protein R [Melghiribacillus thermohalophilus]|uniref:Stage II sporulation protein R n=1 Tax=Melghiribacillus thermohalophilus TaxID=1324956 RepID=A0A4R3ND54_9BACI|nr:stage II sporulation protein R [Melghiribacillus thermohalophilus]TCT26390.1 stage II sporulation protein R [Melghiribacillus thermohalophilus]